MNKFWKQTMALFLAFALVFGTLVPVVAWAEEPANVEEPTVESKPDAPAEKETQTEPEEQLPAEETEGKETEENEELELSKENTPDAQGEPASTDKPFTVTKRPYKNPDADEEPVGEYGTFHEAIGACKQEELENLYIVTMHHDYTIPKTEGFWGRSKVNMLLRSDEGQQYTLKRMGARQLMSLQDARLEVRNVILDGNNDGELTYLTDASELILGNGAVVQRFFDSESFDGPAIFLKGTSKLTIESGAEIKDNHSEITDTSAYRSGVIYASSTSTVEIKGGVFENNSCQGDGGVITGGQQSTIKIAGGTFQNNRTQKVGGVIMTRGKLEIENAKFEKNSASTGGAIYTMGATKVTSATFQSNQANWGGAISNAGEMTLTGSRFEENKGTYYGGAIYQQGGNLHAKNTVFTKNMMTGNSNAGGAIYFNKNLQGEQRIETCTFAENSAVWGAGIYLDVNTMLYVGKSTFTKNEGVFGAALATPAQKSVDQNKAQLTIAEDSSFTENKAYQGGALFTAVPTIIKNTTFKENNALSLGGDDEKNPHSSGVGGAIYVMNYKTEISETKFEKNTAYGSGGAIGVNGVTRNDQGQITGVKSDAKLEITDGTSFKSNTAEVGQGGAIYVIPYAYTDPVTSNDPILANDLYKKLETDATTIFENNKTGSGYYTPPKNYGDFDKLQFKTNSFTGKPVVDEKLHKSLLNNYDVNYKNPNVTVLYDANSGAFAGGEKTKSEQYTIDTGEGQDPEVEITILSETPTRAGHTFVGWKGEDGKTYKAGDQLTIYGNRLFTAIWEETTSTPSRDERIIVDPNGGTFSDGTTGQKTYFREIGETFVLPAAPTREGYKFVAWEGKSGTYQPGYPYIVKTGGEVFTARWEEEKKPEEKPSVTPNIKTPKGTPLTPDEIAKILQGMKKTVPAIPRAGVGK